MEKIITAIFLAIAINGTAISAVNQLDQTKFKSIEALAMKGDYQAQRNVAFGYWQMPYDGQDKNPMMACAWYTIVLYSGSKRVGDGDVSNFKTTCGKLDKAQLAAASSQAKSLYRGIYKRDLDF